MRSACRECGKPVVSNARGDTWYHVPDDQSRPLSIGSSARRSHPAAPGEIKHTCTRIDPLCPLCSEGAKEWLAARLDAAAST